MKREAKMILYADGARGQYIPQHFAESVKRDLVRGIDLADLDYLALGPNDIEATDDEPAHDSEHYWDTWTDVCDNCIVLNPDDAMRLTGCIKTAICGLLSLTRFSMNQPRLAWTRRFMSMTANQK
jgi:hypothetical protein